MVINDSIILDISLFDIFFIILVPINTFELYTGFFTKINTKRIWKKQILETRLNKQKKSIKFLNKKSDNDIIQLMLKYKKKGKKIESDYIKLYLKLKRGIII